MEKLRWDLESIYSNDDLARDEIKNIEKLLEEVKSLKEEPKKI